MVQDKKIDYGKKKVRENQKIWNYIRRNKIFRAGEILIVCGTSFTYFQKYLRFLEKSEYVEFIGKKRNPLTNREYKLIKNTGVKAPLVSNNSLFDYNTGECFDYSPDKKKKIEIPENLIKILKSLNNTEMTRKEIITEANITMSNLAKWWKRLEKVGVVKGKVIELKQNPIKYYFTKYKKRDGFVFEIDLKRANEVLEKVKEGAYSYYRTDLRELWIEQ